MFKANKYNFSAFLLWMAYFCHGIQALTISQNVKHFAVKWDLITPDQLSDTAKLAVATAAVLGAVSWTGIGKISFLVFSGPLSDKVGRKPLIIAGLLGYVIMFGGFLFAESLFLANVLAFIGGAMTSLFDGAINPALFEMYPQNKSTASVLSKALISISSMLYPLFIAYLATNSLSAEIGIILPLVLSVLVLVAVIFAKFPDADLQKAEGLSPTQAIKTLEERQSAGSANVSTGLVKKNKASYAVDLVILPLFALTIYSNFYLFQQASKIYAQNVLSMSESAAATVTSLYQLGGLVATLVFSVMMARGIRDIAILVVSPIFAGLAGLAVFFAPSPMMLTIAGILVGFCSAGGLLQMGNAVLNQFFDTNKGRNTTIYYFVMALGSYIVPELSKALIAKNLGEWIMIVVAITGFASAALMFFAGTRYRHIFGVSIFSNSKTTQSE